MGFKSSLTLEATPAQIQEAIKDPNRLARWWGPEGFTNTIHQFEFQPGGKWKITMHAPNGKDHPSEYTVKSIEPHCIRIDHTTMPAYALTISLDALPEGGTHLTWNQDFENPTLEQTMAPMLEKANMQLLQRLNHELTNHNTPN